MSFDCLYGTKYNDENRKKQTVGKYKKMYTNTKYK